MRKQFYFKSLLSLLFLFVGINAWGQTEGIILFGSANGSTSVNSANVTGTDSQNNNWSIITAGTSSFTPTASYSQIGSSKTPATSITFTMNLSTEQTFNAVSANFGGFNSTAGNVTIAVGETSVATGSLNGGNNVTVSASNIAVKGNVLKITVTDISRGVKVYKISYTLETPETATASPTLTEGGEFQVSKLITITDNAQGAKIYYTTDGNDPTSNSNEYTAPFTINQTTTVKAIAIKDNISSIVSSETYTRTYLNAELSWSESTSTTDLSDDTFTQPTITTAENYDGTVTYASGNTEVAGINETTGEITIKGKGISVITATASKTDLFDTSTATYTLTVTDRENESTYDFTTTEGLAAMGITNIVSGENALDEGVPYTVGSVSMTVTHGSSKTRVWKNNNGTDFRIYKDGGSLTFTVPAGYQITNIDAVGANGTWIPQTMSGNTTWTGSSETVNFTNGSSTSTIKQIVVTISKTSPAVSDVITISEALYGTYYNSNHAYIMPDDCEGYVFTIAKGLERAYEAEAVVPAGEPLVIYSVEKGKKTLTYTETTEASYKSIEMNDLDGVDVLTKLDADESYYFYGLSLNAQSDVNSVGFYWIEDGGAAFTVPAHKAYLKVAKSGNAKSFFLFNEGEVTGINSINAIDKNAPVYNVQGQRVEASTKGIVIQNGRKFFNK